jgi:hypothetical protein
MLDRKARRGRFEPAWRLDERSIAGAPSDLSGGEQLRDVRPLRLAADAGKRVGRRRHQR